MSDEPRPKKAAGDQLRYDFGFSWNSTYARAARLIASQASPGLVLDLGAGVGVLGDAVELFDFDYVGLDGDTANVDAMAARGKTGHHVDLLSDEIDAHVLALVTDVEEMVVAVTMLDVVEHLPDPSSSMAMLARIVDRIAEHQGGAAPLLVLSIPNVAHYDIAAKLVMGRWDVTQVGLLDSTHIAMFDEARLDEVMSSAGFQETRRDDVLIDTTEQQFPVDLPVFGETTLSDFLSGLHERSSSGSHTYQFVRSYQRAKITTDHPESSGASNVVAQEFLSVIVRTQGSRDSLDDTLTSLAAQSDRDIDVLLMVHSVEAQVVKRIESLVARYESGFVSKVRVLQVVGGGRTAPLNAALDAARGRYIAILDDDDVVTPDWVAAFRRAADRSPGRMVRAGCLVQSVEPRRDALIDFEPVTGFEAIYPMQFDFVDTVRANRSPPCSYALPMGTVRSLDISFDESQRVCEDWRFELEVARIAGVADDPAVTSVYRRWRGHGGSAAAEERQVWIDDHEKVIDDLDDVPTLFPPGSLRTIHELYRYIEQLETELGRRDPDDFPYSAP